MIKKLYKLPILLFPILFFGCRIQDPEDYSRNLLQQLSGGSLSSFYRQISSHSGYLYQFIIPAGAVIFLLSFLLFLFNRRETFFPFLGLSGLLLSAVYLTPLLSLWEILPQPELLILQVQTLLLLSYYLSMRSWAIRLLHHRRKPWIRFTRLALISISYLAALLAWFQPGILSVPWIVPLMAVFILLDSTVCSILSMQRKNDRSGYSGLFLSGAALGTMIWFLIGSGPGPSFFRTLDHLFYFMPAVILPVQFVLTLLLLQATTRKQQIDLDALQKRTEEQERSLEKETKDYEVLKTEREESLRVPSFNLKAARKALQIEPVPPLILPETWDGAHFLSDNSSKMPGLAAWSFPYPDSHTTNTLVMAEGPLEDHHTYPLLHMVKNQAQKLMQNGVSPVSFFHELNKELYTLGIIPENPFSGVYLHVKDDLALCGTAGSALVWYKKPGAKMVRVSSAEVPATFQQGLGFRPYSRETGKPYRLKVEKGDTLVITSHSLLFRELELNGEIYGKHSLIRVLENHESSDAQGILTAILKDFEDFDTGSTRDRQIYAAVFRKK